MRLSSLTCRPYCARRYACFQFSMISTTIYNIDTSVAAAEIVRYNLLSNMYGNTLAHVHRHVIHRRL